MHKEKTSAGAAAGGVRPDGEKVVISVVFGREFKELFDEDVVVMADRAR